MKLKFIRWVGLILGILHVPRWLYAPVQNFNFSGISGKIMTPNNDGANDMIRFQFSNPLDSAVTLKIFDLNGATLLVKATLAGATQLQWDGRDDSGNVVHSGIYIYQIESEGKFFNGAIVVAR